MKNIKIPSGKFQITFSNGHGFILSDKILWDAMSDYTFKQEKPEPPKKNETILEKVYDDENPNYFKMSFEEE